MKFICDDTISAEGSVWKFKIYKSGSTKSTSFPKLMTL